MVRRRRARATARAEGRLVTPATPATLVLASRDAAFSALCESLLDDGATFELVVATSTVELLDVARQHEPDAVLLDVDGQDVAVVKTLVSKVALVSDAWVILASGYLAPGSPGLTSLLQSIAGAAVQKPGGATSLSLAEADGAAFVAALRDAFEARPGGGRG
jgi:chemotaxis response regulator CheB